jgi:hypothetical protein
VCAVEREKKAEATRFWEVYYWDSYWVIKYSFLLRTGTTGTKRGSDLTQAAVGERGCRGGGSGVSGVGGDDTEAEVAGGERGCRGHEAGFSGGMTTQRQRS